MIGGIDAINGSIGDLKEDGLVVKVMEGLQDYLSCEINSQTDKKWAWLGQHHHIKNLVKDICSHKTPGTHKVCNIRPIVEAMKISAEDQQEY